VTVSGAKAAKSSGLPEVNTPVVGFTEKGVLRAAVEVVDPSTKGELAPESSREREAMLPEETVPVATAEFGAVIVTLRLPPMPAEIVVVNW
jgi:hypothetical protein